MKRLRVTRIKHLQVPCPSRARLRIPHNGSPQSHHASLIREEKCLKGTLSRMRLTCESMKPEEVRSPTAAANICSAVRRKEAPFADRQPRFGEKTEEQSVRWFFRGSHRRRERVDDLIWGCPEIHKDAESPRCTH